jgi:hypothetical protein
MIIDARDMEPRALYLRLKELFAENRTCDVCIKVLLATQADAKKARAFVEMSGFSTYIEEGEGHYNLRITGSSCRCGL